MRLKLSCADFTFPLLKHDDALNVIAMLGVKGVDVGLMEERSHLQPSDQFRNPSRSGKALKRRLDDKGLRAADVFLIPLRNGKLMAINDPRAARRGKVRHWFEQTLEYAAACGAKHVTSCAGVYLKGQTRSRAWGMSCEALAWQVERAKAYRIEFGVEPAIGNIISRPKTALKLIEDVPGLKYTLDYSHFTRVGIADREVEPLLKHANHFHVRGGCKGALQASFAHNTIDFKRILKVMDRIGYRGYLCLEYVWTVWENCNQVDNLCETILFRDHLRSIKV